MKAFPLPAWLRLVAGSKTKKETAFYSQTTNNWRNITLYEIIAEFSFYRADAKDDRRGLTTSGVGWGAAALVPPIPTSYNRLQVFFSPAPLPDELFLDALVRVCHIFRPTFAVETKSSPSAGLCASAWDFFAGRQNHDLLGRNRFLQIIIIVLYRNQHRSGHRTASLVFFKTPAGGKKRKTSINSNKWRAIC